MSMALPIYHTAEMVRALPEDGKRYETVHGELLVTPSPRHLHQRVVSRMLRILAAYMEAQEIGEALVSPADISWGDDILVQPDVFVVALDEARSMDWSLMKSLLLAVEVLSPSSTRADRFTKRRLYQEVGVPLYWVVDADERFVEVWTPESTFPQFEREELTWHPAGAREPLRISLAELFRPL
jgi:Uma2 family endonuclease